MGNLDSLLHKEVQLKSNSGTKGKIIGFFQKPGDVMDYAIEYWTDNEKKTEWYKRDDFEIV